MAKLKLVMMSHPFKKKTHKNACLSRQMFYRNKHNKSFVATKVLSRQAYFCRDKRRVLSQHMFIVAWYLGQLPPVIGVDWQHCRVS